MDFDVWILSFNCFVVSMRPMCMIQDYMLYGVCGAMCGVSGAIQGER